MWSLEQDQAVIKAELVQEAQELLGEDFSVNESLGYGATDSANKVFFGNIDGQDVAIKPFKDLGTRERAEHEAMMMTEVAAKGFLAATPIDIFVGDRATYLLTEFMPGISTMNQIGWERSINPAYYKRELAPLLGKFGTFVGETHAAGYVHGDLQLKNLARLRTGDFVQNDLEKMKRLADLTPESRLPALTYDIGRLASSLVHRGLLRKSPWDEVECQLVQQLVGPYLDEVDKVPALQSAALEAAVMGIDMARTTHFYQHKKA